MLATLGKTKSRSYSALVRALISRFHPKGMKKSYALKLFSTAYDKKKQTLAQFAHSIQETASLAYPETRGVPEPQLVDYFARGLSNETRRLITLLNADTMEKALSIAYTNEIATEQAENSAEKYKKPRVQLDSINAVHQQNSKRWQRKKKAEQQISAVQPQNLATQASSNVLTMLDKITELVEKVNSKCEKNQNRLDQMEAKTQRTQYVDRNRERKPLSQVECFRCHNLGHFANRCPEREPMNDAQIEGAQQLAAKPTYQAQTAAPILEEEDQWDLQVEMQEQQSQNQGNMLRALLTDN